MKKILFLSTISIGLAFSSEAQITINRSDLGSFIGKRNISAVDTTNLHLISVGNAGANQTWNLAGLSNNALDTISFVNPAGTSCPSSFPSATFATVEQSDIGPSSAYVFDDNTKIELIGFCGVFQPPNMVAIPFSPPRRIIGFPLTYASAHTGINSFTLKFPNDPPPPDSFKIVATTAYSYIIDGWGNLTTPTGTYAALRKKTTLIQTDSSFIFANNIWMPAGDPSIDTTIEYEWYSQNNMFLATINTDVAGNVTDAKYLLSSVVSTPELEAKDSDISVFPNPSNGEITINTNSESQKTIEVFNLLGRKLVSLSDSNMEIKLNLSFQPAGIYHIRVTDGEKTQSKKVIIN